MNDRPTEELDSVIRDELLRQRVRELTGPPRPSTLWEKLTKHSLAPIVTGFLLTGVLGAGITKCTNDNQRERDQAQAERERHRATIQANMVAVEEYARLIGERHARATVLHDAVRRGADTGEVRAAQKAYDDVRVRWLSNLQANGLFIRRSTNSGVTSPLESAVYLGTGPLYTAIDSLLWTASHRPPPEAAAALAALPGLLETSENCGSRITDLLYQEMRRQEMLDPDSLLSGMPAEAVDKIGPACATTGAPQPDSAAG